MTLLLYLTPSTCYLLSSLYVYGEQSSAVALCREEDTIHLGECGQEDGLKNKKEKKNLYFSKMCDNSMNVFSLKSVRLLLNCQFAD